MADDDHAARRTNGRDPSDDGLSESGAWMSLLGTVEGVRLALLDQTAELAAGRIESAELRHTLRTEGADLRAAVREFTAGCALFTAAVKTANASMARRRSPKRAAPKRTKRRR